MLITFCSNFSIVFGILHFDLVHIFWLPFWLPYKFELNNEIMKSRGFSLSALE